MSAQQRIGDMDRKDLEKHLLGKRVTAVDIREDTLTLDDGTVLEFEGVSDCCAYFHAQLSEGNLTDNAVTAVQESGLDETDEPEAWSLHILAADERIASVDIAGDSSSGYYCHSINLIVKPSKETTNA